MKFPGTAFVLHKGIIFIEEEFMKFVLFIIFILCGASLFSQEMSISGDVSVGTGLQAGIGEKRTEWNHTPIFMDFEIMVNTDNDPFLELGASLLMPLESRMGLGFVPKVKLKKGFDTGSEIYTTAGIPLFFIGFNMQGGSIEVGFKQKLGKNFAIFGEGIVAAYPRGKDLPKLDNGEQPMITQFNIAGGISITF